MSCVEGEMRFLDTYRRSYPILEFDSSREAIIEPHFCVMNRNVPPLAVACFFQDAIGELVADHSAEIITSQRSEMGEHAIYSINFRGVDMAVFHACEGAPLAGALLEEVIALGVRSIVACGSAGTLDSEIPEDTIIVPTGAIRDEGTSYHYLPPAREVKPSYRLVSTIKSLLDTRRVNYIEGKTWTTDAVYRETKSKVERRRSDGCVVVEMEAAAFFAIAQFRGIDLAEILYAGDSIGAGSWQGRDWRDRTSIRKKLLHLSIEALHDFALRNITNV